MSVSAKTRRSPFSGTWYPGEASELRALVVGLLDNVPEPEPELESLVGLLAPHAGLRYSGPVAAHAYRPLMERSRPFETVILLGPSHQVFFDALAVYPDGAFATPLGDVSVDTELASGLLASSSGFRAMPEAHANEHSLEMQLPFLQVVLPEAKIVPVMMGNQSAELIEAAATGLAETVDVANRSVLLVASSDLSHYETRTRARELDEDILACLRAFAPETLSRRLEENPRHACGGGPLVSVMKASRTLGAERGRLVDYADSGDTSGDESAVVGYAAAAFSRRQPDADA